LFHHYRVNVGGEELKTYFARTRPAGKNCSIIVEIFCACSSGSVAEKLSTIIPRLFSASAAGRVRAKSCYNYSTIILQLFYNSSLFGRIWGILIGLDNNCRRNNRRAIVKTFGECQNTIGDFFTIICIIDESIPFKTRTK
jgi:hypothetical protein